MNTKSVIFICWSKAVSAEELDEDDETEVSGGANLDYKQIRLVICGKCGTMDLARFGLPPCDYGPEHYRYLLQAPGSEEGKVTTCSDLRQKLHGWYGVAFLNRYEMPPPVF